MQATIGFDLDAVAAFIAVADATSFSAAARALDLPTSTVSRRVAALEATLGVQLLHRTTRRVALTTAGAALHERVAPLLASIRSALSVVPEREELPSGELRVTAAVDIGAVFLAEIVTRFVARYPSVRVDMHLSNERVDLVAAGFDLALRVAMGGKLEGGALVGRKAGALGGALFASPTYLARRGSPRTAADLDGHDFVVYRGNTRVRLESAGEHVNVTMRGRIVCDDMLFVREAARAGAGIAWLPTFLPQAELASGQLVRVLPRWETDGGWLWLVWPSTPHLARKVTAFRDFVIESLRRAPLAPA